MTVNKCGDTKIGFSRFTSNAIGDPYQDSKQYFLRKKESGSPKLKPFLTSSNKKVRKSEFEHIANGPADRPVAESAPRFQTRVKS